MFHYFRGVVVLNSDFNNYPVSLAFDTNDDVIYNLGLTNYQSRKMTSFQEYFNELLKKTSEDIQLYLLSELLLDQSSFGAFEYKIDKIGYSSNFSFYLAMYENSDWFNLDNEVDFCKRIAVKFKEIHSNKLYFSKEINESYPMFDFSHEEELFVSSESEYIYNVCTIYW